VSAGLRRAWDLREGPAEPGASERNKVGSMAYLSSLKHRLRRYRDRRKCPRNGHPLKVIEVRTSFLLENGTPDERFHVCLCGFRREPITK